MPKLYTLFISLVIASITHADELRTLGGKTVTGTVSRITDTEIVLKTDSGDVATPLNQVLALDLKPGKVIDLGKTYTDLRLIDDTLLHCRSVTVKGKDVEAVLPSGLVLKLPLTSVITLQNDAGNSAHKKKWTELASPKIKRDRIVILREGELNAVEGLLGDVDADGTTIQFKREGADTAVPIPIDRVFGLVFWRPDPPADTPICKVIDHEGNTLYAVKLAYAGDTLTVQTTFGAKIPVKGELVARLDFNLGRLTYLSDLEPAKVVEKSGVGLVVRYRRDLNLDGDPIQFDGKGYPKGLSMHAHTELEYNLAGKYKDLKGLLGVDTRTGADSQALVTIWCDGEKKYSKVITPATDEKERDVRLNVKDVQTLKIVVASRNFLDLHDHVTFAEARVSQ